MEIPSVSLKVIILVHWLLSIWGTTAWLTLSYAWANFSMLALGVWAVAQRDSTDAALMFLLGMIITMLTDAVHFGLYYTPPGSLPLKAVDTYRFSMATAISSLLLKPFSCFFIYREYRVRGGEYSIGISSASPNRESYQSIDPQTHPSATAGP
ncbi:type-1 angiotensin II receptor-associated protein-like [Scleropages formosus]|uniref:type-1 angiotensin II receptor-associated protein-like n=1 Tax=Scleropages formosus TaxID=113540 RepID=UPI00087900C5|nr:type-1 angiotensin II receptor-associated protein-like [Scleropages formosus]